MAPEESIPKIEFSAGSPVVPVPVPIPSEPTVPHEFVLLPSRGRVYPRESSLYNIQEVEIRHMMAPDEDILTSAYLLRTGKAIDVLLSNCMCDKSINPDEMIIGDRNAIMVAIRVSGYSKDYTVESVTCPVCRETKQEHTFNLDKTQIKYLEVEPDADGRNIFTFVLPSTERTVKFKFLTAGEEREVNESQEKTRKVISSHTKANVPEHNVTAVLKMQIISIDGIEDRAKISKLIDTMPVADSRPLRNYIRDVGPNVEMKDDFVCPFCGTTSEMEVPITARFFWPDT